MWITKRASALGQACICLPSRRQKRPSGCRDRSLELLANLWGRVDDLVVTTDAECTAYVQVKRTVSLSRSAGSPLASALDQFVRQFLVERAIAEERDDPSDAAQDRFVLAVGAGAPATIQRDSSRDLGTRTSAPRRRAAE